MVALPQRVSRRPTLNYLVVLGLALAALVPGCGGGESSQETAGTATTANATSPRNVNPGPTEAVLQPVGDGKGAGTVRYLKTSAAGEFRVQLRGLRPLPQGGQYFLWMVGSRHDMVPVTTFFVKSDGKFSATFAPNPLRISEIEEGTKTDLLVTSTDNHPEKLEVMEAGGGSYDPAVIGTPVLQGSFTGSLVGEAQDE